MSVSYAEAGTEFLFGPFGRQTVKPDCGNADAGGNWICIAHQESFSNNISKDSHIERAGEHVLAWNCHQHGAESV